MSRGLRYAVPMACALLFAAAPAMAQQHDQGHEQGHEQQGHEQPGHEGHPAPAPAAHPQPQGEAHRGPSGYQRATAPKGWNARPQKFDEKSYQHNYRAARSYRIGPYHRPEGWAAHRWVYGETLPRVYWASEYLIADYWLFALNVPPVGYEWVRDDTDALLISTSTGVILQVDYGVFG
jgi:Ni/Co efflux regulator RcnB